jgi:hypothetical protein
MFLRKHGAVARSIAIYARDTPYLLINSFHRYLARGLFEIRLRFVKCVVYRHVLLGAVRVLTDYGNVVGHVAITKGNKMTLKEYYKKHFAIYIFSVIV